MYIDHENAVPLLSICTRVNTCVHCAHSVCLQLTFSSALFDTDEQCSGFLHVMHKKTCGWVDGDTMMI